MLNLKQYAKKLQLENNILRFYCKLQRKIKGQTLRDDWKIIKGVEKHIIV